MKSELCQHGSDPDGCLCCMDNRLEEKVVSYQAEIARLKEFIKPHETIEEYQKAWEELDDERKAEIERLKAENAAWKKKYDDNDRSLNADVVHAQVELDEAREQLLSQSAHIELLRGALESIEQTVQGQGDFSQSELYNECLNIASHALSSSPDSVLEEVRLLRRVAETAQRFSETIAHNEKCSSECVYLVYAIDDLTAHQKRGSR